MKVVFIGGLTNGKIIVDYILSQKKIELSLIITHPKKLIIQSHVKFSSYEKFTEVIYDLNAIKHIKKIKEIKPDLIIIAGWSGIIPEQILEIPKKGTIGFHPSLLPKDRGRSVLAWQIEEGYTETALTMFYVVSSVDSGNIIDQYKIKILKKDTIKSVLKKCDEATYKLIKKNLVSVLQNTAPRKQQNHKEATYRELRTNKNSKINWSLSSEAIYNKIRAISDPYPCAFFYYKRKKFFVKKGDILPKKNTIKFNSNIPNGSIIKFLGKNGCIVKSSDGFIKLKTVNEIKK